MKKILLFIVAIGILTGCGKSTRPGGELTGVNAVAWNEPAPYGMILIKQGSFALGPAETDSLWGIDKD